MNTMKTKDTSSTIIIPMQFLPSDWSTPFKQTATYVGLMFLLALTSYLIKENISKIYKILNEPSYCILSIYINILSIVSLSM